MTKRVFLIVLDSVGIGELPDADKYGDRGSNTLVNTARYVGGLKLPNLARLGLGKIEAIEGVKVPDRVMAAYGKCAEMAGGKDTTTGHWEMMGCILEKPLPTFPDGFPAPLIAEFEKRIGRRILGNKVASGTEIIAELGAEHMKTGFPIVYTSADSVFQIAAHEEVIPVEELYRMCQVARELLTGEWAVGRVIARPFLGTPGNFTRTPRRHDYSLPPVSETFLDRMQAAGKDVIAVGKINDIFAGRGITSSIPTEDNDDGMGKTLELASRDFNGLAFVNLVDFDMKYGHRNDAVGYARALEEFDSWLSEFLFRLKEDDVLVVTADHGCDPTTASTDHSREYVPVIITGPRFVGEVNLGVRQSFADIGKTVCALLKVGTEGMPGQSFAELLAANV